MAFFIGTSGWNYRHWKGSFYPENISQREWLKFYSNYFDTVEVNATFYRWLKESTFKMWEKDSRKGFIITVKAPRTITHIKKLANAEEQIKDFYKRISYLKAKIGCILFQFPPSFRYNQKNFEKIKLLSENIEKDKFNVIEFREKNWWNPEVYNFFKRTLITFCSVSGNGMPEDILDFGKIVYIRFHSGENDGDYSDRQLQAYASKIRKINKPVYIYFNNDVNAYAIKNALELKRLLS